MKKAVLFDIDGVLIDVRRSYIDAIRKTVELYLAEILDVRPGRMPLLSREDVNGFKLLGGFNNDWDSVYGLLLYFVSLLRSGKKSPSMGILRRLKNLRALRKRVPGPCGMKGIQALLGKNAKIDYALAKAMFQEIYLGGKLYKKRYRKSAKFTCGKGLIEKEKLLIPKAALLSLKRKGARFGIVTGRSRFEAGHVLKRFGIYSLFDAFVTHDEVEEAEKRTGRLLRKPHPYPVLRCAKALGADSFLYLGDLPDDIKAANAAKKKIRIASCGVLYAQDDPARMRRAFREAKADHCIRRPSDLAKLAETQRE